MWSIDLCEENIRMEHVALAAFNVIIILEP